MTSERPQQPGATLLVRSCISHLSSQTFEVVTGCNKLPLRVASSGGSQHWSKSRCCQKVYVCLFVLKLLTWTPGTPLMPSLRLRICLRVSSLLNINQVCCRSMFYIPLAVTHVKSPDQNDSHSLKAKLKHRRMALYVNAAHRCETKVFISWIFLKRFYVFAVLTLLGRSSRHWFDRNLKKLGLFSFGFGFYFFCFVFFLFSYFFFLLTNIKRAGKKNKLFLAAAGIMDSKNIDKE